MIRYSTPESFSSFFPVIILLSLLIISSESLTGQGDRYWDQNLNSEAALLSGVVVAGEGGIAAIYYNPATIPQMTKSSFSLSSNLFSLYFFDANNALGADLPADRVQLNIYPRIVTLTLNPKKKPNLTIEIAYFTKTNEYLQINQGMSFTRDIIASNPGDEYFVGEYYLRSKFQDYNGGAGFGYKLSDKLAAGFSAIVSYKDDQYYNLITADAFTLPESVSATTPQYLSDSRFHLKYNMYDVRLVPKFGLHYRNSSWSFGTNISIPSIKLFGNGTVVRQYEYSNIHKEDGNPEGFNTFYGSRQKKCPSHFKDPLSIAAGVNYYTPSGKSIVLFTAEYFFGLSSFDYIEASNNPGEEGYNYTPASAKEWLSFTTSQKPVFNAGVAFKKNVSNELMISGGFRTDFNYSPADDGKGFLESNKRANYNINVYHFNTGLGYKFTRGSIIMGTQFSYGQEKNQKQIVNITHPVEYLSDLIMPLTGPANNQVLMRYFDISVYFGFLFNFMKE